MRKSTLFISAVLTTFVLAMLAGVASAYQNFIQTDQSEAAAQEQPQVQEVAQSISPAPEEAVNLTPQQAAALAAQVLGHEDLYSVEVTELNGETVYLVTFSSGDLVYISLDGQIRSIGKTEVQTVVVNVSSNGGGGGGGGETVNQSNDSPSNRGGGEDHEDDDDDHDEREDHEDEDEHEDDD